MKKFIPLLLSLFMIFSLVSCGEGESNDSQADNKPAVSKAEQTEEEKTEAEEEVEEDSETEAEEDTKAEEEKADDAETSDEAEAEEEGYKDEINIAVVSSPPTLDPSMASSQLTWDISQNIFEPLYTSDRNFTAQPMLAESYTHSDDFKEYSFKIRRGVKFHNGEEMTAEDVAASMIHWNESNDRAQKLFGIGKWEAISEDEVKVTLDEPASDLLVMMSAQTCYPAIMPKEIVENIDEAEGLSEYIGTGPYKFVSWNPDSEIVLERYEDYQARDEEPSGFAGKREAMVSKVTYHFISDDATRIAGLISGQFDIIEGVPNENYQEIVDAGFEVLTDEGGTTTMFYNVQEGILSDNAMRKAVQTALDFEVIMQACYLDENLYSMNPGYMNPNSKQWGSTAGEEMYNVGDPEKAKEMLEEAGYNGETVRILTTPDYKDMYDSCMYIASQLDAIGMNTEILEFDFPTFMEHREDRSSWDIFVTTNGYQQTPPQLLVLNEGWAGANDPKIAELSKAIRAAETEEEASAKWDELQAFLYDYLSSSAIGQYKDIIACSTKVEDYDFWQAPLVWNVRVKK